jgi:hypothetical protein
VTFQSAGAVAQSRMARRGCEAARLQATHAGFTQSVGGAALSIAQLVVVDGDDDSTPAANTYGFSLLPFQHHDFSPIAWGNIGCACMNRCEAVHALLDWK